MKIKLLHDLPVDPRHGATEGRIFEAADFSEPFGRGSPHWEIVGDTGEKVGVFEREAEIV